MHHWPLAPGWAVAAGYVGRTLVWIAALSFAGSAIAWLRARGAADATAAKIGKAAFVLGAISLFCTLVCLGTLFATDQFEYSYVFGHGDAGTQFRYKIAGIWSGQQGSFLLWGCTSALFGVFAARSARAYRRWFTIVYAAFLASISGILAFETPFELARLNGQVLLPPTGAGLVPSLQNYWVVVHPPTIFMGFGSLTVGFAFGLAAMASGDVKSWVALARPWVLASTAILGLGLCMGGFWAYETLGWGGFWMWDPVENVSFVPWIFSAALLHGLIVQATRNRWVATNLGLAGAPFILFCYGTFLTRSGFLADASVHSFAEMNRTALWILAGIVGLAALAYYGVLLWRGRRLARELQGASPAEGGVHRESLYASGVILLCGLAAAVAIGMSIPFFRALMHENSKVVEEGLYHRVVVWFFVPIMLLMAAAPYVGWRRLSREELVARFVEVSVFAYAAMGLVGLWFLGFKLGFWGAQLDPAATIPFPAGLRVNMVDWILFLAWCALFSVLANGWRLVTTFKRSNLGVGGFVAHMGIAILLAGLIVSRGFEAHQTVKLQPNDEVKGLDYLISYERMTGDDLFDRNNKVLFDVIGKNDSFVAQPGLYYVTNEQGELSAMVWPHIEHQLTHDVYFSLHPPQLDVWPDPVPFAIGQTMDPEHDGIEVTYHGFKMVGKGGAVGTKFVADVDVRVRGEGNRWTKHHIEPSVQVTADGPQSDITPIDEALVMTLSGINATDHSAMLQVHLAAPLYTIDLYYKPMVGLVWLGAGVTALGGLIAAFYRRPPKPAPFAGTPAPKASAADPIEETV